MDPRPLLRRIPAAALTLLAANALAATSALAADAPPFAGAWTVDPAYCKISQESEFAPMVMTATGYDHHELHCTFTSLKAEGGAYTAAATCLAAGKKLEDAFIFLVAGDVMTLKRGALVRRFMRCK